MLKVLLVILILAVLAVLWYVLTYNGLVKLRNLCDEAFSTMDVYMKKRYDLIPNLVESVKAYAAHEKETLAKIVEARGAATSAGSVAARAQAESQLTAGLKGLFAIAENYPELKANQNFLDLQRQLEKVEEDIANSRKYYNGTVRQYNTRCESIPSNVVAAMAHFVKKELFEVSEPEARENVKVDFS